MSEERQRTPFSKEWRRPGMLQVAASEHGVRSHSLVFAGEGSQHIETRRRLAFGAVSRF